MRSFHVVPVYPMCQMMTACSAGCFNMKCGRCISPPWPRSFSEAIRYHYDLRALQSHVRHHLQTPRTAVRPSSLRSVPSGLPRIMEKTQKNAAIHARRTIAILKKGDRTKTTIEVATPYTSLDSDTPDGWSESGSGCIHWIEDDRSSTDGGRMQTSRSWM
jgi:hypothetical protein